MQQHQPKNQFSFPRLHLQESIESNLRNFGFIYTYISTELLTRSIFPAVCPDVSRSKPANVIPSTTATTRCVDSQAEGLHMDSDRSRMFLAQEKFWLVKVKPAEFELAYFERRTIRTNDKTFSFFVMQKDLHDSTKLQFKRN